MRVESEHLTPELQAEIQPLSENHWDEVNIYKDIPLNMDWDTYTAAENMDRLALFTVRDDGRLIGYAAYYLSPQGHDRENLYALQDALYVVPEFRGKASIQLIRESTARLKELGVVVVLQNVKVTHDFGPMLERMGYEKTESVYSRRLN